MIKVWDVGAAAAELAGGFRELERIRCDAVGRYRKDLRNLVLMSVAIAPFAFPVLFLLLFLLAPGLAIDSLHLQVTAAATLLVCGGFFFFGKFTLKNDAAEEYEGAYKKLVLGRLMNAVEPSLELRKFGGLDREELLRAGLMKDYPDQLITDDLYRGRLGATSLYFAEVHALVDRVVPGTTSQQKPIRMTAFRGLLIAADFHKHFSGRVTVLPRDGGKVFEKLLLGISSRELTLEDDDFTKRFRVFADDPVVAHYLLTPRLQAGLVSLRERLKAPLEVRLQDSRMWIVARGTRDWFPVAKRLPAGDAGQLKTIFEEIRACCEVVEELDLNTRIWTKV